MKSILVTDWEAAQCSCQTGANWLYANCRHNSQNTVQPFLDRSMNQNDKMPFGSEDIKQRLRGVCDILHINFSGNRVDYIG